MDRIRHSKKRATAGWMVLLILVLALASVAAAYVSERSRSDDLAKRNRTLQTQVEQLQEKNANQQSDPQTTQSDTTHRSEKGVAVTVYAPEDDTIAKSPLGVVGMVPGTWSFEASFPVVLKDGKGKVLATTPAQVQGNWQTEEYVPFAVSLTFDKPTTDTGTLVLQKDNPSGLAENDDSVVIPVTFRK